MSVYNKICNETEAEAIVFRLTSDSSARLPRETLMLASRDRPVCGSLEHDADRARTAGQTARRLHIFSLLLCAQYVCLFLLLAWHVSLEKHARTCSYGNEEEEKSYPLCFRSRKEFTTGRNKTYHPQRNGIENVRKIKGEVFVCASSDSCSTAKFSPAKKNCTISRNISTETAREPGTFYFTVYLLSGSFFSPFLVFSMHQEPGRRWKDSSASHALVARVLVTRQEETLHATVQRTKGHISGLYKRAKSHY